MQFNIDYPAGMIQPKGLNIPHLEDVQKAVVLVKIVLNYAPSTDFEDNEDFTVQVSDEVFVFGNKLMDCNDTGEGLIICPSASPWTVETVFEMILHALFGDRRMK